MKENIKAQTKDEISLAFVYYFLRLSFLAPIRDASPRVPRLIGSPVSGSFLPVGFSAGFSEDLASSLGVALPLFSLGLAFLGFSSLAFGSSFKSLISLASSLVFGSSLPSSFTSALELSCGSSVGNSTFEPFLVSWGSFLSSAGSFLLSAGSSVGTSTFVPFLVSVGFSITAGSFFASLGVSCVFSRIAGSVVTPLLGSTGLIGSVGFTGSVGLTGSVGFFGYDKST